MEGEVYKQINDLENKICDLWDELMYLKESVGITENVEYTENVNSNVTVTPVVPVVPVTDAVVPNNPVKSYFNSVSKPKRRVKKLNITEGDIGKYAMGVLASLMIFVAIGVFARGVWENIPDLIKAMAIILPSLCVAAFGLYKINQANKYTVFWTSVVSCGLSASFIGIATGAVVWGVFNKYVSLALMVSWFIGVLAISNKWHSPAYNIIGYIGSIIAIGLVMADSTDGAINHTLVVVIASLWMVISEYNNYKHKLNSSIIVRLSSIIFTMIVALEFVVFIYSIYSTVFSRLMLGLFVVVIVSYILNKENSVQNESNIDEIVKAITSIIGYLILTLAVSVKVYSILAIAIYLIVPEVFKHLAKNNDSFYIRLLSGMYIIAVAIVNLHNYGVLASVPLVYLMVRESLVNDTELHGEINKIGLVGFGYFAQSVYVVNYLSTGVGENILVIVHSLNILILVVTLFISNKNWMSVYAPVSWLVILQASAISDELMNADYVLPMLVSLVIYIGYLKFNKEKDRLMPKLAVIITWATSMVCYFSSGDNDKLSLWMMIATLIALGMSWYDYHQAIGEFSVKSILRHNLAIWTTCVMLWIVSWAQYEGHEGFSTYRNYGMVINFIAAVLVLANRVYLESRMEYKSRITEIINKAFYWFNLAVINIILTLNGLFDTSTFESVCATAILIAIPSVNLYLSLKYKGLLHNIVTVILANYSIFCSSSVWGFSDELLIVSIIGLVISSVFIAFGFRYNNKSLRVLGLLTVIVYVIKICIFDVPNISGSGINVLSMIIGGLICFGISYAYDKLDKIYSVES